MINSRRNLPEIIDLDEPEALLLESERDSRERSVTMAFTAFYCANKIPNSSLITLRAWIGLEPPIPSPLQRLSIPLALKVAELRANSTEPSFLMGACMIMDEMKRIYTVEEQNMILDNVNKLENKDDC